MPLHIVQRGHNRQTVFKTPDDFEYYLSNLIEKKKDFQVQIHAYCLMTNHVHLIVTPGDKPVNVSRLMRVVAARQTRRINKLEERTGTLWESRFKASLIDSDAYLLACYRYVELNPVRAAIVASAGDYDWSSYRHNSSASGASWLDHSATYQEIGNTDEERAASYRDFVTEGISEDELVLIRTAVRRNQLTGTERFQHEIAARTGRRILPRAPGRPISTK